MQHTPQQNPERTRRVGSTGNPSLTLRVLSGLFLFLCAFVSLCDTQAQQLKPREGEVRAVWIHTYGPFDWDGEMKKLADAGFNTVFFRAARGANTVYPSKYLPRDEWAEPLSSDELEKAIIAAHRNGLELHAWMVCFHVGGAAKQNGEAKKLYDQMAADDRLVRDMGGKQAPFLNPADPRNQEQELNIAREIVEKYDIDGIHLDYIRYPDEPHFNFDYGDVSRREFEKAAHGQVVNWPADVYSGVLKTQYEDWERSNISSLVQGVYSQTKKLKPRVQVSAAVWRAHRYYRAKIKQDWPLWAENRWLDFVVPMDYTTDDTRFYNDVRSQVGAAGGRVLVVAGIGSYKHETPDATLRQIQIAREEGADGYALFDYKPEKYDALLAALKQGAQSQSTYVPLRTPRMRFQHWSKESFPRQDAPQTFIAGNAMEIAGKIFGPQGTHDRTMSFSLGVETPTEILLTQLGRVEASSDWAPVEPPELRWQFEIPHGLFRIVLRGQRVEQGKTVSFVVRGPMWEGFTQAEFSNLTQSRKDAKEK